MSSDKFHCTNGHCLTDCVLASVDYDRNYPPKHCPHSGIEVYWQKCNEAKKEKTLFDRITLSPEVLAPKLVRVNVSERTGIFYTSMIVCGSWNDEAEAIAATVAKLKEVEK